MGLRLLAAIVMVLSPHQSLGAPVECATIANDLDRLACYDREVGRTPKVSVVPSPGKWRTHAEKNVLTDRTDVFISVESTEEINCGWNRGDKIQLTLRCHENTTAVVITTQCHMTSSDYSDYGHVTYRLDAEKAQIARMDASTNNRSLGLWSGGRAIPVIKQMLGKSSMIVKMTPYGENSFTATFPIAGIDEAVAQIRSECKW